MGKTAKVGAKGNTDDELLAWRRIYRTLVWAANLADLELHASLAKRRRSRAPR